MVINICDKLLHIMKEGRIGWLDRAVPPGRARRRAEVRVMAAASSGGKDLLFFIPLLPARYEN